ncbi:MAG: diacylglycerol kinase family lipid kinase [Erysipelotrichaceae bacterium]|nr:diacylglycerol kinase family lipid kinase [Erysipelotrichaceae bacterium]
MKTLFIYNPNAGKMQIKNYLYDILNIFAKAEYDLTVVPTRKSGEATIYIKKNCHKYDLIICSGGDGTLNEVTSGLMYSKNEKLPLLGYIPAGSTNDFASSLKIPKNMIEAAEFVVKGKANSFDIGKFNRRHFIYIAAFGAFTRVSYATPQDIKNILGHLAYLIEGIKSISDIKSHHLKIHSKEYSGEGDFIYGMVTNTYSVGGVYQLDRKKVKLDDGLFEVLLVKMPKDLLELNEINRYFLGLTKKSDVVLSFTTNEIHFEADGDLAWTLDGEYGGNPNKVTIKNINKAIEIINKK